MTAAHALQRVGKSRSRIGKTVNPWGPNGGPDATGMMVSHMGQLENGGLEQGWPSGAAWGKGAKRLVSERSPQPRRDLAWGTKAKVRIAMPH